MMKWTRRQILFGIGCTAAALGFGAPFFGGKLKAKLRFSDWRALPGTPLSLDIDGRDLDQLAIDILAIDNGNEIRIQTLRGAKNLEITTPYIPTQRDSFTLVAQARDWRNRTQRSEPVEVLANPFQFGL